MGAESHSSVLTTVGVAAAVAGLTVAQPLATVAAPAVLAALVVEGSSTNQSGQGIENFFQGRFNTGPGAPTYVNFLTGPFGIWRALADNPGQNTVVSSGWGAANASLLVSYLQATGTDPELLENTTWVLDNNVANPNGGFGTRYPIFALIGVNPIPTPSDTGATIISTAYEYDINGNAPKYILNPIADLNSLVAYLDRRLTQADLVLPVKDDGTPDCETYSCRQDGNVTYITFQDANGKDVTARVETVGSVTYVGYESDGLPLVQPLRDYGGEAGNKIADAIEPALTAVVDYGYPDNDPLANPGTLERAALVPTAAETSKFLQDFSDGVKQGAETLNSDSGAADTSSPVTTEKVAAQPKPTGGPLLNVLREAQKFVPGEKEAESGKHGKTLPKPVPISVKGALEKLSNAFSGKDSQDSGDADAGSASGATQ